MADATREDVMITNGASGVRSEGSATDMAQQHQSQMQAQEQQRQLQGPQNECAKLSRREILQAEIACMTKGREAAQQAFDQSDGKEF